MTMGFIFARMGSEPPAMNVRVAAWAPVGPPDTGTPANSPRWEASTAWATEREVGTSMVLHSMKSFGGLPWGTERRPVVGSVKTSLTCFPRGSMVMIIFCSFSLVLIIFEFLKVRLSRRIGKINFPDLPVVSCH